MFSLMILMVGLAHASEVSLSYFLSSAWQSSAVKGAEGFKTQEGEQSLAATHGRYLPQVSLEAIDTTGFAASNSDLHVGGVMGSPFRTGIAGGVVIEQTIYDFGRIRSALEQAKAEGRVNQAKLAEQKLRFLSNLGHLYLACAQSLSLQQQDERLMKWATLNLRETARLTRTGQRSIIDNSLVKSEINDLELQMSELKKSQTSYAQQMGTYANADIGCRPLAESWQVKLGTELRVPSPMVLLAEAQNELSLAHEEEAHSKQMPIIKAVGSAGVIEGARLVPEQNFAAGLALVYPLWNGGEEAHREHGYRAQVSYQQQILKAAQVEWEIQIKNLRDEFQRTKESLSLVESNLDHGRKTMQLATERYRSLQGPLVDVREAFKQLRSIESESTRLLFTLAKDSLELELTQL